MAGGKELGFGVFVDEAKRGLTKGLLEWAGDYCCFVWNALGYFLGLEVLRMQKGNPLNILSRDARSLPRVIEKLVVIVNILEKRSQILKVDRIRLVFTLPFKLTQS